MPPSCPRPLDNVIEIVLHFCRIEFCIFAGNYRLEYATNFRLIYLYSNHTIAIARIIAFASMEWSRMFDPTTDRGRSDTVADEDVILGLFREWVSELCAAHKAGDDEAEHDAAQARAFAIEPKIAAIPAASAAGLAVKTYMLLAIECEFAGGDHPAGLNPLMYAMAPVGSVLLRDLARFVPDIEPLVADVLAEELDRAVDCEIGRSVRWPLPEELRHELDQIIEDVGRKDFDELIQWHNSPRTEAEAWFIANRERILARINPQKLAEELAEHAARRANCDQVLEAVAAYGWV
jgi:hypothetical protein